VDLTCQHQPDYIGITSTTSTILSAERLAKVLKRRIPGIKILLGGHHISALREEVMHRCPDFDIGIVGEGEQTLEELLEAVKNAEDLRLVNGIIAREGNRISVTNQRDLIDNIDNLSFPAFDLLPDISSNYHIPLQSKKNSPSFSLITSRGCRGQCVFCDRSVFGNRVRFNSAEYIMEMLRYIYKRGIRCVLFEDDDFLVSKNRLAKLRDLIIKEDIKISWSCCSRIDTFDRESLQIAKEAGCWQIMVGVESAERSCLDLLKKRINLENLREKLELANKVGIEIKAFLMFGNPGETEESLQKTTDFVLSMPLNDLSITFFTPFPGTEIWKTITDYGQFDAESDKLTCFEPAFIPKGLNKRLLVKYQKSALVRFYLRPRIIYGYLKRIKSFSLFKELIQGLVSFICYCLRGQRKGIAEKKIIIVNADDFGLSEKINEGIEIAYKEGIVRSASIVSCGEAFIHAKEIAMRNSGLDIGVHLCLNAEKALLSRDEIPTLVNNQGYFFKTIYGFLFAYLLGRIKREDIKKELEAQVERVINSGLKPSHIDSHGYFHLLPGIMDIVIGLAKKYKIPFIRCSVGKTLNTKELDILHRLRRIICQFVLNSLYLLNRGKLKASHILTTDNYYGFCESGRLTQRSLRNIINSVGPGISEIVCHPGLADTNGGSKYQRWRYQWERELFCLSSPQIKELITAEDIELGCFLNLGSKINH